MAKSDLFKYIEDMTTKTGNTRGGDSEGNALARLLQGHKPLPRSNAEALGRGVREFVLPHVIGEIMGQIKTRNDRNTAEKVKKQLTAAYPKWRALHPDEANMPLRLQKGGNNNVDNLTGPEVDAPFQQPAQPTAPANGFNKGFDQAIANAAPELSPQKVAGLFGAVQGAAPAAENLGADALEAIKSLGENEELKKLIGNGLFGGIGGGGF